MWLTKPLMLLDGATGTELGRRGVDISLPLWSAHAILEAPHILAETHRDYLLGGADIITANTFRTHRRSLHKVGMGDRARELTQRAVDIALETRDRYKPDALVVGSVAPLEDCYRPELAPDAKTCEAEHGEMISNLIDAGVDGILIETQNNLHEAEAAANQARQLARDRWMISFITSHAPEDPPGMLLSGESLADLLPALHDAAAIGVNCTAAPSTEAQVKLLRLLLPHAHDEPPAEPGAKGFATAIATPSGANVQQHHQQHDHPRHPQQQHHHARHPRSPRIMAYANVSKACADGTWHSTDAVDPEVYADYAARWIAAGATIIGGCCGTRPQMIQAIARRLGQNTASDI